MPRSISLGVLAVLAMSASGCGVPPDSPRETGAGTAPVKAPGKTAPAPAATERTELSCDYPVTAGEKLATIENRFGSAALRKQFYGPEGITIDGIVLWGDDPRRRIELILDEDKLDRVVGWQIGPGSGWRFSDLAVGDPLSRLVAANARPFKFYGFSWDYGGFVSDWRGGALEKPSGGCTMSLRLAPGVDDLPVELMGDHELSSDLPALAKAKVRIEEIAVGFR